MKQGDSVTVVVVTPVATTEEVLVVERMTNEHVYIEGLKIPFSKETGQKTEVFSGSGCYIKELYDENKRRNTKGGLRKN